MDVPEAMRLSRHLIAHPGGDLSARAVECLAAVLGEAEDARQSERELRATMRRMAEERDAARAKLKAARAVVEAARRFDEATNPCDLRAGIYAANGSGDEVEPLVDEAYASADLLREAIGRYDAVTAARGEKAGE